MNNSNLMFPNYNKETKTNENLNSEDSIPIYQDEKHLIKLVVNNAEPYGVYLVDTWNGNDFSIIKQINEGIKDVLERYLEG